MHRSAKVKLHSFHLLLSIDKKRGSSLRTKNEKVTFVCIASQAVRRALACGTALNTETYKAPLGHGTSFCSHHKSDRLMEHAEVLSSPDLMNLFCLRLFGSLEKGLSDVVHSLWKLQSDCNGKADERVPDHLQNDPASIIQYLRETARDLRKTSVHKNASTELSRLQQLMPAFGVIREQRNSFAHAELVLPIKIKQLLRCSKDVLLAFSEFSSCRSKLENVNNLIRTFNWHTRNDRLAPGQEVTVFVQYFERLSPTPLRLFSSTPQHLFGRDRMIDDIVHFLTESCQRNEHAQVLLHGPHGVGKTLLMKLVAKKTKHLFDKQCLLQATTADVLLADLSFFLKCNSSQRSCREQLGRLCTGCKVLLLLDDVRSVMFVLSLLPPNRSCSIIFTSVCQADWKSAGLIPAQVRSFHVDALNTEDSFKLFIHIIQSEGGKELVWRCEREELKAELLHLLEKKMLNIPLAVRLVAFQFASKNLTSPLQLSGSDDLKGRTEWDCAAAWRDHVRGFFHVVKFAFHSISKSCSALKLCMCLAILPPRGTPQWFVDLLGLQLNSKFQRADENPLEDLLKTGLVTLEDKESFVVMHGLVQECVRHELTREAFSQACSTIASVTYSKLIQSSDRSLREILSSIHDLVNLKRSPRLELLQNLQGSVSLYQTIAIINSFLEHEERDGFRRMISYICLKSLSRCYNLVGDHFGVISIYERLREFLLDVRTEEGIGLVVGGFWGRFSIEVYLAEVSKLEYEELYDHALVDLMLIKKSSDHLYVFFLTSLMAYFRKENDPKLALSVFTKAEDSTNVSRVMEGFSKSREPVYFDCIIQVVLGRAEAGNVLAAEDILADLIRKWLPVRTDCAVRFYEDIVDAIVSISKTLRSSGRSMRSLAWLDFGQNLLNCVWNLKSPTLLAWKVRCTRTAFCNLSKTTGNNKTSTPHLWLKQCKSLSEEDKSGMGLRVVIEAFINEHFVFDSSTTKATSAAVSPIVFLDVALSWVDAVSSQLQFIPEYSRIREDDTLLCFLDFFCVLLATIWKTGFGISRTMEAILQEILNLNPDQLNFIKVLKYIAGLDESSGGLVSKAAEQFFVDYSDLESIAQLVVCTDKGQTHALEAPVLDVENLPSRKVPVDEMLRRYCQFFASLLGELKSKQEDDRPEDSQKLSTSEQEKIRVLLKGCLLFLKLGKKSLLCSSLAFVKKYLHRKFFLWR